jgi:hypothetical protein
MQQGSDLLTQLAAIRERQGKEPLPNPGFIQGFGPGSPAPPPPIIVPSDIEDPDEEPSPLIPPQQFYVKKASGPPVSIDPQIPNFKLIVMDNAAQYAGHGVVLQDAERDRIAEIIVKAVKRELDGQMQTLGLREAQATGLVPKRKRGRPRKDATPTPAAS